MCGRATLATPVEDIAEQLGVDLGAVPIEIGPPRFNVAPGQPIVVVRAKGDARGEPELALVKWGLVPRWAKAEDTKRLGSRGVQARAETVERTPAFRDAWDGRRCLVVVDGFYEWRTLPDGRRVPHHIRMKDGRVMALGGVWDRWHRKGTPALETGAVITTQAHGPIRALHNRMPLIVPASERDVWLGGSVRDAHALLEHAMKTQEEAALELVITPVSTWVNDVRHEDARCIEPVPLEG